MTKKYIVGLSAEEKAQLLELTRRSKPSARKVKRAQILLLADEGKTDEEISKALHVGFSTVERTRKRLVREGFSAALNERPRPAAMPFRPEQCRLRMRSSGVNTLPLPPLTVAAEAERREPAEERRSAPPLKSRRVYGRAN